MNGLIIDELIATVRKVEQASFVCDGGMDRHAEELRDAGMKSRPAVVTGERIAPLPSPLEGRLASYEGASDGPSHRELEMRCFGCNAPMECNWCPEGECECRKDEQVMCSACMWLREGR